MSSFIDRWINRMNSHQSHNSRPMNTVSYATLASKQSGNSPVYFKQKQEVHTSPNLLNTPVAYFEQEGYISKDQFEKIMDSQDRKGSIGSIDSSERKGSISSIDDQ